MTVFEPPTPGGKGQRRLGSTVILAGTVVLATLALLLAGGGAILLPPQLESALTPSTLAAGESAPAEPPPLPEDIVPIADMMFLTDEGRRVLAESRPRLAGAAEVREVCGGDFHGCFMGLQASRNADAIVVYRPDDDRLIGSVVTTAAHELLHAVYERLDDDERARVDALLAAEIVRIPPTDHIHQQIEKSVRGDERNRSTELFAFLGTQIMPEGGLPPDLEAVYARTFTDRAALVDTFRRHEAMLIDATAAVDAGWAEVVELEASSSRARAQHEADVVALEAEIAAYNREVERFNLTDEAARRHVRYSPPGGDEQPTALPWAEALAAWLSHIERRRAHLDERAAELVQAEAAAARRRGEVQALYDDTVALLDAAQGN